MTWLLLVALAWTALALPFGLLLGRGMRVADRRDAVRLQSRIPDFIPAELLAAVAAQQRQRG
ncbi:hypothetical protein E4P40_02005 [Blastococcus sp. CT_GayMR20]|uniref:hypothetical protein n=1 Tax=Blastococcus sp. CT_GayMR20 TaxID=2559609 RepID=UPI00107335B6|nr:hypothetical protein [Blastococcus sp. CT_GayMR20]TFV92698.1 hypothetical protein E4P40_01855 [Blastococcus sp. CT_GayMR20]TFV92721.1 hypothetical protein E4P40_02005 [Blastococcus sp. CT_GayMR20]